MTDKRNRTHLSRRAFVSASAASLALPAYIRPGWAQGKRLVIVNSGGAVGEAKRRTLYAPFTKATGIEIVSAQGTDLAKLRAQVQANNIEWDVTDVASGQLALAARLGLLERVDTSIVDMRDAIPQAKHEYAVGGSVYAGGMAYPANRLTQASPRRWVDFWNPKAFPGRRSLRNRIDDVLEIALMGDGVPASEVYPCDVERAFKALDKLKPFVSHWISATEQTVTLIQGNETDFTYTYSSRVMNANGVGFSDQQQLLGIGWIAAVKGSKNRDAAMRFLAYTMDRDAQVAYSAASAQSPTFPDAVVRVPESVRKWLPDITSKQHLFLQGDWWEGRQQELQLRFKEWLLT